MEVRAVYGLIGGVGRKCEPEPSSYTSTAISTTKRSPMTGTTKGVPILQILFILSVIPVRRSVDMCVTFGGFRIWWGRS